MDLELTVLIKYKKFFKDKISHEFVLILYSKFRLYLTFLNSDFYLLVPTPKSWLPKASGRRLSI